MYNLHVHLVFTTKYRRGALTDPILTRCEEIMADVCRDFGAELREFNGETDHVHLLVHYRRAGVPALRTAEDPRVTPGNHLPGVTHRSRG